MSAPPVPARRVRRTSLGTRIAVLCVLVAIVTGIVGGGLAINLIRQSTDGSARRELSQLATALQVRSENSRPIRFELRARRLLSTLHIRYGQIEADGQVASPYPLVRRSITAADVAHIRAGDTVSASRTVRGKQVFLEARPVSGGGGLVVVQSISDATASGTAAIRRTLLAILIGVAVAVLLGLLVAARMARPLRRTALAAHALADGRRDVGVPPEGPAEVAEVATAINRLAFALGHSEARQREFLLSVSHDLRTPLTAISGYAESLADGVVPPERIEEVGGILLGEAQRLTRLVGDLLDLARLDAQDFRVELADVDLAGLARSAAQVWDARCRAVGVVFVLEARPARAWTDAARVRQALDGLLENALRVTPAGAPIVLAVWATPDGAAWAEVRDGGPGLREEDLAVAFRRSELYERYRGVRQVGTGLGLAIVHGLVTRLGGHIEAGHAREGGARFTVRLPAPQPPAAQPIAGR